MPLSAGTRLGPYEILAPLGAGGMGEVYRAAFANHQYGTGTRLLLRPPLRPSHGTVSKTLEMDPGFAQAHLYLGLVYEQKGRFADAIAELQLAGSGAGPRYVSALGHAYAVSGQRKMAEEFLARLNEQAKQRYVAPYDIAEIHIGLEEKEQALKYLEMAYADHSCFMIFLRYDPRFDGIRGDPRYQDILRCMHLTP